LLYILLYLFYLHLGQAYWQQTIYLCEKVLCLSSDSSEHHTRRRENLKSHILCLTLYRNFLLQIITLVSSAKIMGSDKVLILEEDHLRVL
jgi:hypothetical protein